ncbi:MAG: stage II sporulation protein R [Clostridia bacterium]|nr:stage II sporulation protein R [Clostridia bacterium]
MKLRMLELSAVIALFVCIISCVSFENDCEDIRENVLRLHVIADSDSEEAQSVKLKVRDALLSEGRELFEGNSDIEEAETSISENLELMKAAAERTLRENGYTYSAEIELTECYFPTRQYGGVTLPAGNYNALRVVLGEGEGHNWWCVMFPPMCLPAAQKEQAKLSDVLDERGLDIVTGGKRYEVRLWIVEKWYELWER